MQVRFEMQKAWDARSRKFYGARYDHRRNAVSFASAAVSNCCLKFFMHARMRTLAVPSPGGSSAQPWCVISLE